MHERGRSGRYALLALFAALLLALGGLAAAGAFRDDVAWVALLVAVVLTCVSGLDYARVAPRVLRGRQPA